MKKALQSGIPHSSLCHQAITMASGWPLQCPHTHGPLLILIKILQAQWNETSHMGSTVPSAGVGLTLCCEAWSTPPVLPHETCPQTGYGAT